MNRDQFERASSILKEIDYLNREIANLKGSIIQSPFVEPLRLQNYTVYASSKLKAHVIITMKKQVSLEVFTNRIRILDLEMEFEKL